MLQPGNPYAISFPDLISPIEVTNGQAFPPIKVQVQDEMGNPCSQLKKLKVQCKVRAKNNAVA